MPRKQATLDNIKLEKLVHGGQCIAEAPDGRKLLVWGGLPGEVVNVRITKNKRSYLEGIVTKVIQPSKDRVEPKEPESYLSTSPWQILDWQAENSAKQEILTETFEREGIKKIIFEPFVANASGRTVESGDSFDPSRAIRNQKGVFYDVYGYRNKMEFGFWGDDDGLHLAHYVRGTHGKQIITESKLANSLINATAVRFIRQINDFADVSILRAGDLKTVVFRCSQNEEVVAALFVKKELSFDAFKLPEGLKGLVIYYSNPKSPASVPTKKLYSFGDIKLSDTISGINITYDVLSFFQVNLPMFEQVLQVIKSNLSTRNAHESDSVRSRDSQARRITDTVQRDSQGSKPDMAMKPTESVDTQQSRLAGAFRVVDLYSGVGTIGMVVGADILVESDKNNVQMAKANAKNTKIQVIHANSEAALDKLAENDVIIVDPPRAGLHKNLIAKLAELRASQIVYLSCNPSTQARDVKLLEQQYKITYAQGFNFFPRTPHIESLVVLEPR